jgi:hypothetical protein
MVIFLSLEFFSLFEEDELYYARVMCNIFNAGPNGKFNFKYFLGNFFNFFLSPRNELTNFEGRAGMPRTARWLEMPLPSTAVSSRFTKSFAINCFNSCLSDDSELRAFCVVRCTLANP